MDLKNYKQSELEIKTSISFLEKNILAETIIKNSHLAKENYVFMDRSKKYLMYIFALVTSYTNLKLDSKNIIFEYDTMKSNGSLEYILKTIPKQEQKELQDILDWKEKDFIDNHMNFRTVITEQIDKIIKIFKEINLESLVKVLDDTLKLENTEE